MSMQLEEFERAVESSYHNRPIDDARKRHRQFILAIEDQVMKIENSLVTSVASEGKASEPTMHLDKGERDELALFLSGPSVSEGKSMAKNSVIDDVKKQETDTESAPGSPSVKREPLEAGGTKANGHRRIASASADFSSWKIAVADDDSPHGQRYLEEKPGRPPRKTPSFSVLSSIDSSSKFKWPSNGYRKLKVMVNGDKHDDASTRNAQISRVITELAFMFRSRTYIYCFNFVTKVLLLCLLFLF